MTAKMDNADDKQIENHIKLFTGAILREKSGNFPRLKRSRDGSVFSSTDGATTNRGNKLLQHAEGVKRTSLRNYDGSQEGHVFYNGSVHKLLARNRHNIEDNEDESSSGSNVDLHELVDVRQILAPIASLEDIAKHPAVSKTFQSSVFRGLALQAVLMIEKEQNNVVAFSNVLEAFLGDYPGSLAERTLELEEYDHNLSLRDSSTSGYTTADQPEPVKAEQDLSDGDPFFALPQFNPHNSLPSVISQREGPLSEEVEAARQLTQIALQRNQEFIRNLQKIRNCIVKAERIKERINMWSREFAGIPEEGVTVPNALHVVKRGLISATTNRTMTEEELEAEEADDLLQDKPV
ncbi:LAFA_0F16270g1_1 [Lachancea sp. 'fantastica']|nr:LAFA_0F16270g1_1 [Lachancea sp. 'fantastica']